MPARRWYLALAAVAAGALLVRFAHLAEIAGTPLVAVLLGDARAYDAWAREIASGRWLGTEVFYQAPLYPYLLGAFYAVAGQTAAGARVLQAVLGSLACVLLAAAGRRFFTERAGLVAGALLACYPAAVFFDSVLQKSSLDLLLMTLLLALAGEFLSRPRRRWLVAAGATLGLFMLSRENTRVLYPVVAGWLLLGFTSVPWRQRLLWLAVFTAGAAAVLAPVAARNYYVGGELLVSTSQAGSNFYIGNHLGARGSYESLLPDRGDPAYEREDAARLAEQAADRALAAGEVSDYWMGRAFDDIRREPWSWLRLMGWKLLLAINAGELADTESIAAYSEYSRVLRWLRWFNVGLILPLAALGVWLTRRNRGTLAILYALASAFVLSVAFFYVVERYRHPVVPILLLFAAAAIAAVPDLFAARKPAADPARGNKRRQKGAAGDEAVRGGNASGSRWRPWAPAIAAAACVAVVANLPIALTHDDTYFRLGAELLRDGRAAEALPLLERAAAASPEYAPPRVLLGEALNRLGRPAEAILRLDEAVRLSPDSGTARSAYGLALAKSGRPGEAIEHLTAAVRLQPESADAHVNLGMAFGQAGRPGDALDEFRRALSLDPDNATINNNLGAALAQQGDVMAAVPLLERAVALKPDYGEAHANLAMALRAAGNADGALTHFSQAARLLPGNYVLHAELGQLLMAGGRTAEAVAQFEEAVRLAPESPEVLYLLGQACARTGQVSRAKQSLEEALRQARAAGDAELAKEIEAAIVTLTTAARPAPHRAPAGSSRGDPGGGRSESRR